MAGAALRLDPPRLDRAFALAARHVEDGITGYAGLAVGSMSGPVRIEAFDRQGHLSTPHRSPIASITKPITAVAVMQLVEAGELVLHEPLASYLPEFRPSPHVDGEEDEPITVWHLLTHTSGLPEPDRLVDSVPRAAADIVAGLCRARPRFRPGTAFWYTTDTFYLLAEVVARISGRPFEAYLAEHVLGPLAMTATSFDPDEPGPSVPVDGTFGPPGQSQRALRDLMRLTAMPGGGLWSTPEDVLRFGRAMLGGGTVGGVRVLGRPFVELMVRHHTAGIRELGTGRAPNYGLAWGFPGLGRGTPSSRGSFGHAGGTGSILLVDPVADLVIVHLRNHWDATMKATDEVVQAVYGAIAD